MEPIFTPPPLRLLPIENISDGFPVGRIFCVGRNYSDHVKEMGGNPDTAQPVFFMKPPTALVSRGGDVAYPPRTQDLHHEVELVVALKSGGRNIPVSQAASHVYGSAVGVDLTRRDLQAEAKKAGAPWDAAKAFDGSAPIGTIRSGPAPSQGKITLAVNGETRQSGDLKDMTRDIPALIAELSGLFALQAGDLIFTGTPAGVSALEPGDVVAARVADLPELKFKVTETPR
ncbi:MAG: fumarylacetoacetate hydrolase [Maricaulis sp.]|jgi:fumarylpyruvate hydrolase|nr:fumarylacetoacetate hydrolase [Maricaulis sp.]HAQ34084.1 fumarylacetoacetate hydrolase [Alphaproteobacteria bacterium]